MNKYDKPKETNVKWSEIPFPKENNLKCNHYFEFVEGGECKCVSCHMGLIGVVKLVDGKPL